MQRQAEDAGVDTVHAICMPVRLLVLIEGALIKCCQSDTSMRRRNRLANVYDDRNMTGNPRFPKLCRVNNMSQNYNDVFISNADFLV